MTTGYSALLAQGLLQDPGAVPLVIGVTGHRDPIPEAVPVVRKLTRDQLQQLMTALPHTPLVMLNGMAEGIDIEIAEEFLSVVNDQRNACAGNAHLLPQHQLIAALPKTPEDFSGDFTDTTWLTRMQSLLKRSDAILHPGNCEELRIPPPIEGKAASIDDPTPYAQQGVFVVRHCYLLLAFYDGKDTKLMGGTSQVVAMQREEIHPLFVNVAEVTASREPAALICIGTPRRKNPNPEHQLKELRYWPAGPEENEILTTDPTVPDEILKLPRQIDAINRCIASPLLEPQRDREGTRTRLHSILSREATALKQRHERSILLVVFFGFALVVIAELLEGTPWLGAAILILLVSLALLPRLQQQSKQRFIEKRALAECMSVQYLWSAVGVELDTADLFHVRNHTQLRIARMILRAVKVQLLGLYSREERPMQHVVLAAGAWVEGQVQFFERRIAAFRKYNHRCHLLAWVMGGIASLVGFAQFLPGTPEDFYVVAIALLAASASFYAYGELIGFEETANRYERSLQQFTRGMRALKILRTGEVGTLGADPADPWLRDHVVMEAMGREKIDELNDWIADQIQRIYRPGG